MDLTGQTILVTGFDRGIGRAIVEELAPSAMPTCSAACATWTASSS